MNQKSDKPERFPNTYMKIKLRCLCPNSVFVGGLVVITYMLYSMCISQTYGNESPVFTTQEISDDLKDFVGIQEYGGLNSTLCESIANEADVPNIDSIKYVSDGKHLNATVFLSGPFAYNETYASFQDINSNLDIGYGQINNKSSLRIQDLLNASIVSHNKYTKNFTVIENKTFITKNNYPAYELIYRSFRSYGNATSAEFGIVKGHMLFLMEYSSLPALFLKNLPQLHTIIHSIKFYPMEQLMPSMIETNLRISKGYSVYTNQSSIYRLVMAVPSYWTPRPYSFVSPHSNNYTGIQRFVFDHLHFDERYNMLVDVHSTFDQGPDYLINYRFFGRQGWEKSVNEISSKGHEKFLGSELPNDLQNKSNVDDEYFISMDFDLEKANNPSQYSVFIYKDIRFYVGGDSCFVVDTTGWMPIPPPRFSISALPNILELRPDEEKIVKLEIHNNSSLNANFSISNKKETELRVDIIPSTVSLVPNGDTSINLKIKNISTNKKEPISHVIPIDMMISFPQNTTIFGENITLTNTASSKTIQNYYYTVTTLPALELKDRLDILAGWISPLNSVWTFLAAIGAILVPLLVRIYSRRKQPDKMNTQGSDN